MSLILLSPGCKRGHKEVVNYLLTEWYDRGFLYVWKALQPISVRKHLENQYTYKRFLLEIHSLSGELSEPFLNDAPCYLS